MILELSAYFPVKALCELMDVQRSSFYNWKKHLTDPSDRKKNYVHNLMLFKECHEKYPSHGYRWLNAKLRVDFGLVLSDSMAYKCCKELGIQSKSKRIRRRSYGKAATMAFPNLLIAGMNIDGPMQCIVSDMTAFYFNGVYYELTLYMDLWNNEILSHALSSRRGDRQTYISGLESLLELKKQHPEFKMVLHSDQGVVYSSKAYNELLPMYNVARSMSRAGTPTDNAAMEAINGWIKDELFMDFHITGKKSMKDEVADYIVFFNEQRPAYALNYLTPKEYRVQFYEQQQIADSRS